MQSDCWWARRGLCMVMVVHVDSLGRFRCFCVRGWEIMTFEYDVTDDNYDSRVSDGRGKCLFCKRCNKFRSTNVILFWIWLLVKSRSMIIIVISQIDIRYCWGWCTCEYARVVFVARVAGVADAWGGRREWSLEAAGRRRGGDARARRQRGAVPGRAHAPPRAPQRAPRRAPQRAPRRRPSPRVVPGRTTERNCNFTVDEPKQLITCHKSNNSNF